MTIWIICCKIRFFTTKYDITTQTSFKYWTTSQSSPRISGKVRHSPCTHFSPAPQDHFGSPARGWQNRSDWPKSDFDSDFDPRWLKKWKSDPESDFDRVFGFVLILILILILIRKVILFLILILKVILILILILRPFFKCLFWLVVRAYVILLQVDPFRTVCLNSFVFIAVRYW